MYIDSPCQGCDKAPPVLEAQTKVKYLKLIHFVLVGEAKILLTVWMDQYLKVCIHQTYLECIVTAFTVLQTVVIVNIGKRCLLR